MAKDPICGMDVQEKDAQYFYHFEHETIYFCSNQCQKTYAQNTGIKSSSKKKGAFARFLEKLAKANDDTYGGTPPKCH